MDSPSSNGLPWLNRDEDIGVLTPGPLVILAI